MKLPIIIFSFFIVITSLSIAQESESKNKSESTSKATTEVDPSKPTNLYTQINAQAEVSFAKGYNLYGSRFNVQYTFNPNNLLLLEVPLMYNDLTKKFGLADMRVRYFSVVKRNLTKKIIALAPFIDISLPTGSTTHLLGAGRWNIGVGSVVGILINKNISLFPGVSYVHVTKSKDNIPLDVSSDGFSTQINMSISFSKRLFLFVNPIYTQLFSNNTSTSIWTGEFNLNYIVKPNKFKVNFGWFPNFTNNINTFRLGTTFYL